MMCFDVTGTVSTTCGFPQVKVTSERTPLCTCDMCVLVLYS